VLSIAGRLYGSHRLSKKDAHTLRLDVGGVSYVPIPKAGEAHLTGLLTVDAPARVRPGERFDVVVRQVTSAHGAAPPPPPTPPRAARRAEAAAGEPLNWRQVIGAFQLAMPAHGHAVLRDREERDYATLLWIGKSIPADSRWRKVFDRYLDVIAGRIASFGGDPSGIAPSPNGDGGRKHAPKGEHDFERTGKIASLVYDRFGDFEGFVLETEAGERHYESRERNMEALVDRAWRERLRLSVWAEPDAPHRPLRILLRRPQGHPRE
jgi:hypothetical protein